MTSATKEGRIVPAVLQECTEALLAFTHAFDTGDLTAMQQHFAPDGVWIRQDGTCTGRTGRAGLAALMARRNPGVFVRHVITNVRGRPAGEREIALESYVTVYRHDFDGIPQTPAPLSGPDLVGRYFDTFRLCESQWLLARREVKVDFKHMHKAKESA